MITLFIFIIIIPAHHLNFNLYHHQMINLVYSKDLSIHFINFISFNFIINLLQISIIPLFFIIINIINLIVKYII
jgi:hypothetical protein